MAGGHAMVRTHGLLACPARQQQDLFRTSAPAIASAAALRLRHALCYATHVSRKRLPRRLLHVLQLHHLVALRALGRLHAGELMLAPVLYTHGELRKKKESVLSQVRRIEAARKSQKLQPMVSPGTWGTQRAADPTHGIRQTRSVDPAAPSASLRRPSTATWKLVYDWSSCRAPPQVKRKWRTEKTRPTLEAPTCVRCERCLESRLLWHSHRWATRGCGSRVWL
jgi:hypothetical protein